MDNPAWSRVMKWLQEIRPGAAPAGREGGGRQHPHRARAFPGSRPSPDVSTHAKARGEKREHPQRGKEQRNRGVDGWVDREEQ
jgi:hypothetical protein